MKDLIRKLTPRTKRALVILIIAKLCIKLIVVLFALSILAPHTSGSARGAEVDEAQGVEIHKETCETGSGTEPVNGSGNWKETEPVNGSEIGKTTETVNGSETATGTETRRELTAGRKTETICFRPSRKGRWLEASRRPEAVKGTAQPPEGVIPRAHFWDGKGEMRLASITIDGLKREYYIYRPAGSHVYPLPTVFAFHGHGGTARGMDKFTGGITALADREGVLLVFPDGIDKGWCDGREANAKPVRDDVKFISTLIDHLVSSSLADARRVYACGMSNGGFFTQYIAMKIPEKLAGAASVGASLSPEQEPFKSGRAIPMMYMLGTKDPLVPWDGGRIGLKRMQRRGRCVPATRAISFWLDNNGISSRNQTSERVPDINRADRCTASKTMYGNGNPRSDVVVYQIDNGGHTWPGGQQYLPAFIIGNTNRDFNANEVLWGFFKEHHN